QRYFVIPSSAPCYSSTLSSYFLCFPSITLLLSSFLCPSLYFFFSLYVGYLFLPVLLPLLILHHSLFPEYLLQLVPLPLPFFPSTLAICFCLFFRLSSCSTLLFFLATC